MTRQASPCASKGEPYRPVAVDAVLGKRGVVPGDADGKVVAEAPTATDLAGRGEGYFPDLPGNALKPGCDYERWFKSVAADVPTSVYAHIVTETGRPGKLALQY